jgi:tetratricopeptide (TPR) repeat protein
MFCPQNALACASSLMDRGEIDWAAAVLDSLTGDVTNTIDYAMAVGRLRILRGQSGDSILTQVAAMCLSRARAIPQDPMNYYMAGQAFSLMCQLEKSKENLDVSLFLERRPYFVGTTILELGRIADLRGDRDEAKRYYNQVISMNAGAYQKRLAQKYLKDKYVNGH